VRPLQKNGMGHTRRNSFDCLKNPQNMIGEEDTKQAKQARKEGALSAPCVTLRCVPVCTVGLRTSRQVIF
jgi:hypothetical protein